MNHIETKLIELKLKLPKPLKAIGDYVPFQKTKLASNNSLISISGQVPVRDGELVCGQVGNDISQADGVAAAKLCALAVLAQLKAACDGDLSLVRHCVRLGGFVNAAPGFANHPEIINGASELIVMVLGEAGKHSRFAVGASSLPRNVAVEIEAQFEAELI